MVGLYRKIFVLEYKLRGNKHPFQAIFKMNQITSLLIIIEGGNWQPGIGDPNLMGWLTVIAYFGVGTMSLFSGWRSHQRGKSSLFWYFVAGILLFLGINKQLDLQSWLTVTGKKAAIAGGWYAQRRTVQSYFIGGLITSSFCFLMFLWQNFQQEWQKYKLAFLGIICLTSFVIIRAASFHHVDRMLGWYMGVFKLNWLLELGGIALIARGISHYLHLISQKQKITK